ncbi:23S rRNA (guanosine(2251)-2'-O)-methyltransferase RlmB [Chitinophaga horti]|uniref:23S rRNA (Guanosine(2251)-2'-O)-methyltransferase RlmB n=1 Tax=Chitinophaga horti TaxID=2920382 RepID=A0ABY6J4F8_9BACT|nr:23S rRNA (guanosine(2251)-2'-O)-methyltransferase RlmB [Chitinophaga horti]UYQ94390.1 23S rRNA (guanosine(2251)-2'-O)-methyltransferase RlmB [Chitinophaga horti]
MNQRNFKPFKGGKREGGGFARKPHAPKPKQSSLIIGRQPVIEALNAGTAIERIFMLRNAGGEIMLQIRNEAMAKQVPINMVPAEKLDSLTQATHQGVIAITAKVSYLDLQDVISHVMESGETPLFLILDGITDVRNIGAIARSAVCCGAQAIIIPDKGIAALNEEAVKSSAGALERISVCRVNSLLKAVDTLHLNGIKVVASEMTAETKLYDMEWKEPLAIIMGSEDKGVYPALLKAADGIFNIPMAGGFESFNVSVAAGIIMYEAMKQRLLAAE